MEDDTLFNTMIDLWRESHGRGRALTAEELCLDCPELAGELDREIMVRELRRLEIPEADSRAAGPGRCDPAAPARGDEPVAGYRLVSRIGRGGSAEVWSAVGPGGFAVAMKFVRLIDGDGLLESMSLESRRRARHANLRSLELMREVRHPNLLSLFGAWHRDGQLILGMELADRTLMDRLDEAGRDGPGGIPRAELLEYMRQAARGVDFLNEPRHALLGRRGVGIQHRDIKPQNLLLVGGSVKVGDFGLAKLLEETATLDTGSLTPAYAAPELFEGRTSARSDQYSLAVTYCHLAGGRLPFVGSPWEVMMGHHREAPDLSMLPGIERPTVARALAKRPEDRWPDCRSFIEALIAAGADHRGPSAVRPPLGTAPEKEPTRDERPTVARKAALVVALLAVPCVLLGLNRPVVPGRVEERAAIVARESGPGRDDARTEPDIDPVVPGRFEGRAGIAPGERRPGRDVTRTDPDFNTRPTGVAMAARWVLEIAAASTRLESIRLAALRHVGPIEEGLVAGVRARLAVAVAEHRPAAERELERIESRRRAAVVEREQLDRTTATLAAAERRRVADRELERDESLRRAADEREQAEHRMASLAAAERRRVAERELRRIEEELRVARERKKAAAAPAPRTATIHVLMPVEKAELIVRGEVGRGNPDEWYGPRRVIHTPPMTGRTDYIVGAFWTDPVAGPATRSRAIKVEPGRDYEVDLRPDVPTWKEIER